MKEANMKSNNHFPKWWQLYLIFPLMVLLFVFDSRINISTIGHQLVQIGSLGLILSFVYIWLKANMNALSRMDQERNGGRITGLLYQHENKLPLGKDPYADFRSRNSYAGGQLNPPVYEDTKELGYSLPADVRQQTDKERT